MKITKNKNKYFSYLQKQFSKFAVFLVVASMLFGTFSINQTFAYFTSSATVSGNTFTAGTLSIDLNNTNTFSSGLLYPTDSTSTSMSISNTGSLDSQYIAKTTLLGGDTSACDYINMIATSPTSTYTGLIKDFVSSKAPTINTTWNYDFAVSSTAPASVWGKTCYFVWNYTAWQSNLSDSSSGFTSVKEKSGSIRIGKAVVMNEILPNPEGLDTQLGLQGEWVELYNNSNISIDLAGWKIKDSDGHEKIISSSNTMNGRTTIGPKGSGLEWVVVFMNGQILNNDGDTVYFTDQLDNPIDQYSYISSSTDDDSDSNSTGGASNSNPSGSETAGNEGKSYARIPDGVGEWVDPIPTPGEPNIDGEVIPTDKIIVPKELLPSLPEATTSLQAGAPLLEEIPPASPEKVTETGGVVPEVITDIPPATKPEEVITEESEVVETPISEVIEPKIIQIVDPVATELTPAISETEVILEPTPVVKASSVEPATIEPVSNEIK